MHRDELTQAQLPTMEVDAMKQFIDVCASGDKETATMLLSETLTLLDQSSASTALFTACHRGSRDIAVLLLQHQASVDQSKMTGTTPLHVACQNGHKDLVALLLDAGASVNQAKVPRLSTSSRLLCPNIYR